MDKKHQAVHGVAWKVACADFVIRNLSWIVIRHTMQIRIDSFTREDMADATPDYGPWELSTSRANVAHRRLIHYGLSNDKLKSLTGYVSGELSKANHFRKGLSEHLEISFSVKNTKKEKESDDGKFLEGPC